MGRGHRSGQLSRMHKRGKFRRGKVNRDPLRRIVDREPLDPSKDLWNREILECGHRLAPREDFIGQTNAVRRRCPFCARDARTAPAPEVR